MSGYSEVPTEELETLLARVITPGEVVDTKLFGRAVLNDLRQRGFEIVRRPMRDSDSHGF